MGHSKQSSKEPELSSLFPYNTRMTRASHAVHAELTGQLLRRTLVRRDYYRAYKIYSIMTTKKNIAEEFVWKIGCEILRQKSEYEPLCLRFLQLIFTKSKDCREAILVETALYQLRCGKLEDARETLEPYREMYPYDENPLVQGYAGVIEFALWTKAIRAMTTRTGNKQNAEASIRSLPQLGQGHLESDDGSDVDSYDFWLSADNDESQDCMARKADISRYEHNADRLLERALQLNGRNDMFLVYLVILRCGKVDFSGMDSKAMPQARKDAISEMRSFLRRFYGNNKYSLLSLQLLAALENRERQQTLELILKHDPAADSELYVRPLLNMLKKRLGSEQREIIMQENSHTKTSSRYKIHASSQDQRTILHGMDIKDFRPILELLLMRAEFGVLTGWEEQELVRICDLVCFCSACGETTEVRKQSCFEDLPLEAQPPWYNKLALILSRIK
ncbi:hypothetical protein BC939DRAFT_456399 [Gamsiella multidivaricata]|uniref:uncharacterized protein n=1 Tax=Gamsiella multidivaricata TaxID=101098 RepID=UPI002220FADB|nr:uncharacterized protein BC939DRAFT_456399 [Gamsiella multidivaricata]KAG0367286.1 hypothetical protein BGZ54_004114 [Gamsiella multidivaricata]KAI7821063.1 hypothetical protein BC939DRAFT_456399 [Gamsiella multidivaricata]